MIRDCNFLVFGFDRGERTQGNGVHQTVHTKTQTRRGQRCPAHVARRGAGNIVPRGQVHGSDVGRYGVRTRNPQHRLRLSGRRRFELFRVHHQRPSYQLTLRSRFQRDVHGEENVFFWGGDESIGVIWR